MLSSLICGQLDEIAPAVRRLVAGNPGLMTGPGTNTYLLGRERFLVIDPGPLDEAHAARIIDETAGRIDAVLVTHTHPDHSPAAHWLAQKTGASLLGRLPPADSHQDPSFVPTRVLEDGATIDIEDLRVLALHTPGHASNHVCYLLEGAGLLFTGDHLMQGSTVVIAPPDGHMGEYLRSLQRLQREPATRIAPGHGTTIEDAQEEIARIIRHRLQREAKVLGCLARAGSGTVDTLVAHVYDDVDSRLHPLARSSLLAHLIKLAEEGRVVSDGGADDGRACVWTCRGVGV